MIPKPILRGNGFNPAYPRARLSPSSPPDFVHDGQDRHDRFNRRLAVKKRDGHVFLKGDHRLLDNEDSRQYAKHRQDHVDESMREIKTPGQDESDKPHRNNKPANYRHQSMAAEDSEESMNVEAEFRIRQ